MAAAPSPARDDPYRRLFPSCRGRAVDAWPRHEPVFTAGRRTGARPGGVSAISPCKRCFNRNRAMNRTRQKLAIGPACHISNSTPAVRPGADDQVGIGNSCASSSVLGVRRDRTMDRAVAFRHFALRAAARAGDFLSASLIECDPRNPGDHCRGQLRLPPAARKYQAPSPSRAYHGRTRTRPRA